MIAYKLFAGLLYKRPLNPTYNLCQLTNISEDCTTKIFVKDDGNEYCGVHLKNNYDWIHANNTCVLMGARLPLIKSTKENKDIRDLQVRLEE